MRWPALPLLALTLAVPAHAQESEGFQSPSGNIFCSYFADNLGESVRCDIGEMNTIPPERPADCDLDWGNAFEVTVRASQGARICYGDPIRDDAFPVLDYGQNFRRGAINCVSERTGVTCENDGGAGFFLSRNEQRLF